MRRLLNDEFPSVGKYLVVDCRYPYEYHGGHITVRAQDYIYCKSPGPVKLSLILLIEILIFSSPPLMDDSISSETNLMLLMIYYGI